MKFIIDSEQKTITLIGKLSLKEFEKIKIWLGTDWDNWSIDASERVVEKNNWYPFIPTAPTTEYPEIIYVTQPSTIEPLPYYPTTCYNVNNSSELLIECNSVDELTSYKAFIGQVNYCSDKY